MTALTSLKRFHAPWPGPLGACAAMLGDRVLRLREAPEALFRALARFPALEVTTRSDAVSLCQRGRLVPAESSHDGLLTVQGSHLYLQARNDQWALVLAILAPVAGLASRSVLFFDRHGQLQLKVQVPEGTPGMDFEELVCAFLHPDQHPLPVPQPLPLHSYAACVDLAALEQAWSVPATPGDFEALLAAHGISRLGAYCRVRDKFARAVKLDSLPALLSLAAARRAPVSLRVFSGGCRQWHQGVLPLPAWQGTALRLCQDDLELRLETAQIASAWRVRRPSGRQIVTTVELFDHRDERVLVLRSGCGQGELPSWRALLADCLLPPD
ncbi:ChuX/HutX family heme-like substrate-binding protein [Isoalcanivorax indicus]|uniref:ChuX/HutX family heme-like substrate-binding protein n=1 Tax=Isoalcanivorax indicus TaxID=2202653 RepID=UPI000DB994FE|nr:ChuX/HutX family heme-like substrate-binding protein [Isoalcanivorax indicus]